MFSSRDLFPSLEVAATTESALSGEGGILLVEDDDMLADLVTRLLTRLKHPIFYAADAASAVAQMKQHHASISLAMVDCQLPDMPGGDLCLELRSQIPGLALLLTSGRDQRALKTNLAAGGPTAFLAKPFLPGEVVSRVTALLSVSSRR